MFDDPQWHLDEVEKGLDAAARWMEEVMRFDPSLEQLREQFIAWMRAEEEKMGLSAEVTQAYQLANPPGMSADGLLRYWKKVRMQ
jgi:hypothetical protein